MNAEEIVKEIEEGYYPDWKPSFGARELASLFKEASEKEVGSTEYYRTKAELLAEIGNNGFDEFSRGKYGQGRITQGIFSNVHHYFLSKEIEGGLI
jgi:hypothetical protein